MKFETVRAAIATVLILSLPSLAVTVGQTDDFQDGSTMGWIEGGASPNPPTNAPDQGPLGAGDNALFNVSSGTQGPGGRAVMLNRSQWGGDYLAAGVTGVTAYVRATTDSAPLTVRLGFEGGSSSRFVTTTGITIPNDDQWYPVSFDISAADLAQVGGADSYTTVMSAVDEFRLISNPSASWFGEVAYTEILVDNVTAVPEPSGLCLLAIAGLGLFARRRD